MAQLIDILTEKIKTVGGKASLGRMLGGIPGQTIFQYTQGVVPSLDFAVKWKKAFNENLIDIMFADEKPSVAEEPEGTYDNLKDRYIRTLEELNLCIKEKEALKKFSTGDKGVRKLKPLKK